MMAIVSGVRQCLAWLSPAEESVSRRTMLVWIALLLFAQLVIGVATARALFVTHDEYWHLPVGLRIWKTGRFIDDPINPPLTRLWAALPAALAGVDPGAMTDHDDAAACGRAFLVVHRDHYLRWFVWGRCFNLLWLTATGVLLARWAAEWFGRSAAVVVTCLWITEPTVLAHGALVTPDAGLMCGMCAVWYVLWRYARRPGWSLALWWGALLGLTQLTKFTAVLLIPLSLVVWVVLWCRGTGRLRHVLAGLGIAWVIWNTGYLWSGTGTAWGDRPVQSRALTRVFATAPFLKQVPSPLPLPYLIGLDGQQHILEGEHPVYLNGAWTTTGFRTYFLWAGWWKGTPAWQLLGLLTLLLAIRKPTPRRWQCLLWCLGPVSLLLLLASLTRMQLGLRYILPVFPFVALWFSQLWDTSDPLAVTPSVGQRVWNWILALCVVLSPLALRYHPEHLAYFNIWAGGPVPGAKCLLDSNLDWGQDLNLLEPELRARGVEHCTLAYFGALPPEDLGIQYELPPGQPVAGWHAVSVNFVYGRPHVVFTGDGTLRPAGLDEWGYFRRFEPVARLGASLWLYHLTPEDITNWRLGRLPKR